MQHDQVKQQERKDTIDSSTYPSQYKFNNKQTKYLLSSQDPQGNDVDNKLKECTNDHCKEIVVIQ